jgi:HEAT repeat protein
MDHPSDRSEPAGDTPLDAMLADLGHPNPLVRMKAARALGVWRDLRAIAPLIDALQDDEVRVVNEVSRALGEIGQPCVPALLEALGSPKTRENASLALGHVNGRITDDSLRTAVLEALIPLTSGQAYWQRRNAIWALGQIGDDRAVPYLAALLDDKRGPFSSEIAFYEGQRIYEVALEALHSIGSQAAIQAIEDWRGRRR